MITLVMMIAHHDKDLCMHKGMTVVMVMMAVS